MTLAFEQAGSFFTGWIRSCLSCLSPGDDGQTSRRQTEDRGVEREMQVNHTQPHLVPPMKLVVYDDLPSPSVHENRNSLSSWIVESRNFASRTSYRASMSWKRNSMAPASSSTSALRISAPSDFRRVQSFHPPPSPWLPTFQPLELSFHRSGNRLPDLPTFDSFQLADERYRQTLPPPPRTLSPTGIRPRLCQSTFAVPRKPVGSGDHRLSVDVESLIEPPAPVRIASSLIPHFSVVNPVEIPSPDDVEMRPVLGHTRSESEPPRLTADMEWMIPARTAPTPWDMPPQTPPAKQDDEPDFAAITPSRGCPDSRESPSTASSRTMPSQISSLRRPSLPLAENRKTIASFPSLSNRVTQWFFPTATKDPFSPKQVSLPGEHGFMWDRTRTLSGTTVGSTVTTTIIGGAKARNHNSSISSTFTGATTPRTSLRGPSPTLEKDFDAGLCHPTIYEDQQQQYRHSADYAGAYRRYRESTFGLAF
ncbi:hypothetical protein NUU61_008584 [Penicillium alfredii]|uniref:Uncharacterized protein n=1 Tax=Penicillium alfredii TaxID=1506179 RepID=A0A9W9ELN4_9EURO|nr:uncharacterized protein NUU61_008584 [Penicillium alfredii]KAJ5084005.1 hypothetical protein NUU61_008584 [Penicillium alfredii]